MASTGVAYNPNDPLQQAFLSALALGETGGAPNSASEGVGGADLSSIIKSGAVDRFGFPVWSGFGNSHAAGTFQFQPSTWDSIAQEYGLNFANSNDQAEGAWLLAQQTDPSLYSDLQSGNYSSIQTALKNVWPSVTGNGAAPAGLAGDLSTAVGVTTTAQNNTNATNNAATNATGNNSSSSSNSPGGFDPIGWITGTFAQGSLIIIGAVIIFVALWMLLSSTGAVPGPKEAAKTALTIGAL